MTLTNTAGTAAVPDAQSARSGRRGASALQPDSALAQLAGDLVRMHQPHVAAGSATATCVVCGQPAPCLVSIRAREVLRAAGLNDRPPVDRQNGPRQSGDRQPNERQRAPEPRGANARPAEPAPVTSRQHPESGAELR